MIASTSGATSPSASRSTGKLKFLFARNSVRRARVLSWCVNAQPTASPIEAPRPVIPASHHQERGGVAQTRLASDSESTEVASVRPAWNA